jgi:hypothetical protein
MNCIYVNDIRVGYSARPLGDFVIAIAWIGKRVALGSSANRLAARCKKGKHGTARHSASNRPGPAT